MIDPQAFAERKEELSGMISLQDLDERIGSADFADPSAEVAYRVSGGKDAWARPYLQLALLGSLKLVCQRCLQAADFALDEEVRIVFFADEAALDAAMAADEELDGMVIQAETDLFELIEDQILMALPIAPRHDSCTAADVRDANQNPANPFAALAGLRKTD